MENHLSMSKTTRGRIRSILRHGCLLFIAVVALSCSEDPTDQNSPTAPVPLPLLSIHDTTITATRDSTFKTYVAMDGINNLVGNAEGYTALSVLEFYPSYFVLRDTINVVSASLRLRLSYRLGDAAGPFSFDVYQVTRSWSASTVTWDSVQSGFYDAATKRGSFSGTVASDTDFINIDLDTSMVRQWLSSTATVEQKYGIILVPNPSSSIRGFVQFGTTDSTSYYPTLTIIAANTSGTTLDTSYYFTGIGTFVGDVSLPNDPGILNVQAGVIYRSKLVFDVSFIPRGATINSAVLSLDPVPSSTRLTSFSTDTTVGAQVDLSGDASLIETQSTILSPASGTISTFTGDISHAVQSWVRGPNYGLVLTPTLPAVTSRLDRYGFYSVNASTPGLRPRLKIIYSFGNH
jgi:hypothetical protein